MGHILLVKAYENAGDLRDKTLKYLEELVNLDFNNSDENYIFIVRYRIYDMGIHYTYWSTILVSFNHGLFSIIIDDNCRDKDGSIYIYRLV